MFDKKTYENENNFANMAAGSIPKKKFYKKKRFWLFMFVFFIVIIGIFGESEGEITENNPDTEISETSSEAIDVSTDGEVEDVVSEPETEVTSEQVVPEAEQTDESESSDSWDYVAMVKGGTSEAYPGLTYEEAFNNFFARPKWKYFKSVDGEDIVQFTGKCIYQEVEVKAQIQFLLDVEGQTFEAVYLSFNEVPQDMIMLSTLLETIFESE